MQTMTVKPIVPGYDFTSSLQFVAPDGTTPPTMTSLLTASQVTAQVRAAPGASGALLATAVVTVISPYVLAFSLATADTQTFPSAGVYIDFARLDGATWSPLPVLIRWPVRLPVTTSPALGVPTVSNPLGNLYYTQSQVNNLIASGTPTGYNMNDVGMNVYLLSGQSNEVGNGASFDPTIDIGSPFIWQFPNASAAGAPANVMSPANDPLNFGGSYMTGLIGHAMSFARSQLASTPPNRGILLVPQAVNGSSMAVGQWPAGANFAQTVVTGTGVGAVGDGLTINGQTVTSVTASPTSAQIIYSSNATTFLTNLAAWINANSVACGVTASAVGSTIGLSGASGIILIANVVGFAGNAVALSRTGTSFLVGGAASGVLGCGTDAPGGGYFVNAVAQANLALAANTLVTGSISGVTLTITAITSGPVMLGQPVKEAAAGTIITGIGPGTTNGIGTYTVNVSQTLTSRSLTLVMKNRLVAISWDQGESESTTAGPLYNSLVTAVITGFRTQITGATYVPVMVVGMVPEYVATSPQLQAIDLVHKNIPANITNTSFTFGPSGMSPSVFHYDAPHQRLLGYSLSLGYTRAVNNTLGGAPSAPPSVTISNVTQSQATIAWAQPQGPVSRVKSWLVQWSLKGANSWSSMSVSLNAAPPATGYSAALTGLNANTAYDIQVLGINEQGNGKPSAITTIATLPVYYLLDNIHEPVAASYSLRKLRATYAGNCIRVQRDDTTQLDVGFDANGVVNAATLISFAGGGNLYVIKWYDQSNSNDAAQATIANAPMIMIAGVLQTAGSFPAIYNRANGSNAVFLTSATGYPVAANVTVTSVVGNITLTTTQHVVGPTGSGNHSLALIANVGLKPGYFVGGIEAESSTALPAGGSFSIGVVYTASTTTAQIWQSGALVATNNLVATASAGAGFDIGTYLNLASSQFVGTIQEVVIYSAAALSTEMQAMAAAHALEWNTH